MIRCVSCSHLEPEGTLFCNECGSRLIARPVTGTMGQGRLILKLYCDRGVIFQGILVKPLLLIGRYSDDQSTQPEVDLGPFEGFELGVSRQHASIRNGSAGLLWLTDQGSANGTRINGKRLTPHVEYPLNSGDEIQLGKFVLRAETSRQDE